MNTRVLIAYPSGTRSAEPVAEAIAEGLADVAVTTDVAADNSITDVSGYAALVLGTPRDHDAALHPPKLIWIEPEVQQSLPVAVFGLEATALDETQRTAARAHLLHALTHMPWLHPQAVEVFSMAVEEQPPSPDPPVATLDLLDRDAIRSWAHTLPGVLGLPIPVG